MHWTLQREKLLKPLQLIANIADKRHINPIFSQVLFSIKGNQLSVIGTDSEIELVARVLLEDNFPDFSVTLPARKLLEICRSLPEQALIEFKSDGAKVNVRSGKSRFSLSSLPVDQFPNLPEEKWQIEISVAPIQWRAAVEKTQYAMATQDYREYMNGMLLEINDGIINMVATDGHRMSVSTIEFSKSQEFNLRVLVPRKTVSELLKLLSDENETILLRASQHQLQIKTAQYEFTSRLLDCKFPDYDKAFPSMQSASVAHCDRDLLKHALSRVSILSNEKNRAVRFLFSDNHLAISTNNPDQEEAEEELDIRYEGSGMEISFNVTYVMDFLNAVPAGDVTLWLNNPKTSVIFAGVHLDARNSYVLMPRI
jgi:DNA polymerase-3 subunit beta